MIDSGYPVLVFCYDFVRTRWGLVVGFSRADACHVDGFSFLIEPGPLVLEVDHDGRACLRRGRGCWDIFK